jgi:hypothetical protein
MSIVMKSAGAILLLALCAALAFAAHAEPRAVEQLAPVLALAVIYGGSRFLLECGTGGPTTPSEG